MITYDKFLDADVGMSTKQLRDKMERCGLLFSEELAEAYIRKSVRLSIMVKHLKKMLDKLDVHNTESLIKNDVANLCYRIQEIVGEIEYLAIVCMGLTDIFALFINHSFSLGVATHRVHFSRISDSFKKNTHEKKLLDKIEHQISCIKNMDDYKYISAMNNYAKHNNVICTTLEFSFKPVRFAAIITSFTHNEITYPKTKVNDFVEKIRNIQDKLYSTYRTMLNGQ